MVARLKRWIRRGSPFLIGLSAAFAAPGTLAAVSDCVEDDPVNGRFICFAQLPTPMGVGRCENTADFLSNVRAWCEAGGGTWAGGDCPGYTPEHEEDIPQRSASFLSHLANGSCSVVSDSGWNTPYSGTNFCNPGSGEVYQDGYLIRDSRRVILSCSSGAWPAGAEDIRWRRDRSLVCPFGSTQRSVFRNGVFVTACTLPVCRRCDTVANPVTAAAGIKVETETDYRGAGGLVFTRHYSHMGLPNPVGLPAGGHTPQQLGLAWRSNFDKRVMLVGNPPGILALTFPDGEIQYFNSLGKEIFNYAGARASLVTLPGGGYVYQGPDVIETYRADGRLQSIAQRSGETLTLTYTGGAVGGVFVDQNGNPISEALPANLLVRVTDSYGNTLSFDYSIPGKLVVMTDPSGGRTLYRYDVFASNENLASVTYPDGRTRSYRYAEQANLVVGAGAMPRALTSIVDENGSLYATFKYNGAGVVLSSEHALGAERYQFTRPNAATTNITDPLGAVRTFSFQVVDGLTRLTGNSVPGGAGFGSGVKNRTYDSSSNMQSLTDFNDNKTCYAYDTVRNLETVRVEGLAPAANCATVTAAGAALPAGSRKITTEWHARWRTPARVAEPRRITTSVYNGDAGGACAPAGAVIPDGSPSGQPIGVLCTKTVQSTSDADGGQGFSAALEGLPRTSSFTYNARGKVLTADGPRTDVADITTTSYYAENDPDLGKRGNVATIQNALGHVTNITAYNAHGQPLTIVDPNGLTTTLGYDSRRRLTSRNVGGEVTSYEYDAVGQMSKVTLPDTSFLSYTYDAAHRLTGMNDNLGNRIAYTLDAMGNRTQEQVFDPANVLAQTRSRVFNSLNRLFQEIGAQNQTAEYAYDTQGNLTSINGPLAGNVDMTTNQYDAFNRLKQVTDPGNGVTQYGYNGIDQLVSVTDPRNLATTYNYDGLANLDSQVSPDTGTTTNTYNAAGNLLSQTDGKGQTTSYAYDALNRVSLITFHDGSRQSYVYDQGANGVGRLSSLSELNPAQQLTSVIAYAYDQKGRTISETRTVSGVAYTLGYSYDSSGRLAGLTYPSGRTIAYGFDALGRINDVRTTPLGGTELTVANNIAYHPFGGVKSYTLGNGQTYTRSFDLDGRIASYTLGSTQYNLGYDPASRISFIAENGNPPNTNTYGYDNLDRLTQAILPNTTFGYGYDAVGNRLTKAIGAGTDTYTYAPTSNRIASITPASGPVKSFSFDNNGSTTNDSVNQYVYDTRGRMVQSTGALGVTAYQVNALGQRVRKTNATEDRVYLYDTRGRLIAETDPGGALRREYLYANDIPLAVFQ